MREFTKALSDQFLSLTEPHCVINLISTTYPGLRLWWKQSHELQEHFDSWRGLKVPGTSGGKDDVILEKLQLQKSTLIFKYLEEIFWFMWLSGNETCFFLNCYYTLILLGNMDTIWCCDIFWGQGIECAILFNVREGFLMLCYNGAF